MIYYIFPYGRQGDHLFVAFKLLIVGFVPGILPHAVLFLYTL